MEYIKKTNSGILDHVHAIEGDITQPELGISNIDQQTLFKNVSVVFHSAATVKFDEQLKLSVTINMLGTKRLVELCHKMQKLEVRSGSKDRKRHCISLNVSLHGANIES